MDRDAIPVTLLSGSLGAGKTTLLNHLLSNAGDRDLAVLVNDMGDVNVDADLVENSGLDVAGGVTELSNGCICCELQDDLSRAVTRLARERDFDHLVVEASGISEPEPVARQFTTGSASAPYDLHAVVAVVDSRLFFDAFGGEGVAERRGTDDDSRPLSDLLVEQVEFANVVLLNKADLVSTAELDAVEEMVRVLRPDADVVRTEHSAVDPDRLLAARDADPSTAAGWRQSLDAADDESEHGSEGHEHAEGHAHDDSGQADHAHPEAVYGVTSFTFRRRRPFHPGRLWSFFADVPADVIRSKGTCHVAGRDDLTLAVSQAGPSVRVEATGRWVASLPEFEREAYRRNRSDVEWDDRWGDRRTELVFIGRGMDEAALRSALEDCLVTDAELDAGGFDDRFPAEQGEERVITAP
ncbi:MAG: GTP-binding protein [Haloferacaceae archaeon]